METARRNRAQFAAVWLDAPPETLMTRISGREGDASDATTDVIGKQLDVSLNRQRGINQRLAAQFESR